MNESIFTNTTDRETIYDDDDLKTNWMTIRTIIDLGTEQRIVQLMRDRGRQNSAASTLYLAYYMFCIVDWGGPRFVTQDGKVVPCAPAFVESIKKDDPLFLKVKARIHEIFFGETPNVVLDPNAGSRPIA